MPHRWLRLIWLTVYIGQEVAFTVYRALYLMQCDTVSRACHLGGALTGLFLGLALLRNLVERRWEVAIQYTALGIYALVFAGFVAVAVLQPPTRPIKCIKGFDQMKTLHKHICTITLSVVTEKFFQLSHHGELSTCFTVPSRILIVDYALDRAQR